MIPNKFWCETDIGYTPLVELFCVHNFLSWKIEAYS